MSRLTRTLALGTTTALTIGLAATIAAGPASACTVNANGYCVPDAHPVICDSASVWQHYSSTAGRFGDHWTMYRGENFGHDNGVHPESGGFSYGIDFGTNPLGQTNAWGWIYSYCLG